jgi:hypothetical protein
MFYVYIFLVIVGVLIVVSIPLGIIGDKIRSKNLEKVFGGRQELNERDFYERYFESQGVLFSSSKKFVKFWKTCLMPIYPACRQKMIFQKT